MKHNEDIFKVRWNTIENVYRQYIIDNKIFNKGKFIDYTFDIMKLGIDWS